MHAADGRHTDPDQDRLFTLEEDIGAVGDTPTSDADEAPQRSTRSGIGDGGDQLPETAPTCLMTSQSRPSLAAPPAGPHPHH
jgi:hypothetical protein